MPIAHQLHLMRCTEDFGFGEVVTDKLHTDGQSVTAETCGQGQGGQSCQIHCDGVDVGKVHLHGIVDVAAEFGGGGGRSWGKDEITLRECRLKIVGNEAAQFLGFQVIGIVVAVRQHISANHDAAFDFAAEAFGAGVAVHFFKVAELGGAVAVAHAVVAGKVGAGFGGSEDIVSGNG